MFHRLKIFRAVYEEGGFSMAAKRVGLTQSAVSQQIKAIEEDFSVSLFDPKNRSEPTRAGAYLYRESGRILSEYEDLKSGLKNLESVLGGRIEFGMIDVAAIGLMPRVLKKFRQAYPEVELSAKVKPSGELLNMVEGYSLDFCVAVSHGMDEKFVKKVIYRDSIAAIVDKKSKFAKEKKLRIEDLKGEPLILYPAASYSRKLVDYIFNKKGVMPAVAMEMHYPAAIVSLVAQGMGVGLISELSARQERLHGLKVVEVEELAGAREIALIYLKNRALSPQAEALIKMTAGRF